MDWNAEPVLVLVWCMYGVSFLSFGFFFHTLLCSFLGKKEKRSLISAKTQGNHALLLSSPLAAVPLLLPLAAPPS